MKVVVAAGHTFLGRGLLRHLLRSKKFEVQALAPSAAVSSLQRDLKEYRDRLNIIATPPSPSSEELRERLKERTGSSSSPFSLILLSEEHSEAIAEERRLLELAAGERVEHIVKLSGLNELIGKNSSSAHGRSHAVVEEALEKSPFRYTILRRSMLMQDMLRAPLKDMIRGRLISVPHKGGAISFLDVEDLFQCVEEVLKKPPKENTYNLTGPEAITWAQVAETLSHILGDPVRYSPIPLFTLQPSLWIKGVDPDEINLQVQLGKLVGGGRAATVTKDVEKILGRRPLSFEHFAKKHKEEWPRAETKNNDD